jgi:hypothetical protein
MESCKHEVLTFDPEKYIGLGSENDAKIWVVRCVKCKTAISVLQPMTEMSKELKELRDKVGQLETTVNRIAR